MVLVNGRMSGASARRWRWLGGLAGKLLRNFDLVLVQDEAMAERFRSVGAARDRIVVTGSLKEGAVPLPHDEEERKALQAAVGRRPVWLGASTHAGEEAIVAEAHAMVQKSEPDLLLILAPRHPERGEGLSQMLKSQGFSVAQRSVGERIGPDTDIYLADTLGEMGLWYRISPVSFVGGSLSKDIGGHNPFEPAALGSAILHGPDVSNFRDIYDRLAQNKASLTVTDGASLAEGLRTCLEPDRRGRTCGPCLGGFERGVGRDDRGPQPSGAVPEPRRPMKAPGFWSRPPGVLSTLLWPLSQLWTFGTRRRLRQGAWEKMEIPVICVGNLTAGGAGKTPTVIALLETLGDGAHVVSRGYGGTLKGPVRVDPLRHKAAEVGDEPLLLAAFAPTWVAGDRATGIRAAAEAGARLAVLDDGFQNPGVAKDLSLLVVDAVAGFGNGCVMPAGPLREPVADGLRRADAVVLIGREAERVRFLDRNPVEGPVVAGEIRPLRTGMDWDGLRVVAFAGIGRPEKFFATLRNAGAELAATHALGDHAPLTPALLARLQGEAKRLGAQLVTTEKDAVRLPASMRQEVLTLPVRLHLDEAALGAVLAGISERG